ncbi:MAG TPA: hypothetical protein P5081_01280 [Phycisphaerae bacterium]|nr:hypothetical protein [Phycisphaerae bacterium]HRW51486.1 hypothetical protein [Phycisphaerae bacterium]
MAPERSQSDRVRIHQVRLRAARFHLVDALPVILAIAVSAPTVFFANTKFLAQYIPDPAWYTMILIALANLALPLVFVSLAFRWALNRRRRLTKAADAWRYNRLCRVVAHPEAQRRLPHRVVEHAYFGSISSDKVRRHGIPDLPPGHVIILLDPGDERTPIFDPIDIVFEPIQLGSDVERVNWLTCVSDPEARALLDDETLKSGSPLLHLDIANHREQHHPESDQRRRSARSRYRRFIRSRVARVLFTLYLLAGGAYLVVQLLWNRSGVQRAYWIGPLLGAAIALTIRFVRHRTLFFIPGGVAERTTYFAGRRASVRRFTNTDASIVVTMPLNTMMLIPMAQVFRGDEKPCAMLTPLNALLTAWTATAPTPSEKMLKELLDP